MRAMIAALAAGGTAAYLTDFETTTNSFTVGKVDIELDEPGWKPEENTKTVTYSGDQERPVCERILASTKRLFIWRCRCLSAKCDYRGSRTGPEMPWQKQNFSVMQRTMTGHSWNKKEIGQNMVYTYAYNQYFKSGRKNNNTV